MNIVDEFGDGERGFKDEWREYKYSQLVEMLPLTPEERKAITPDMTVAAIRAYKKSLVATSQQNDDVESTGENKPVATSQQDKIEKAFNAAVPIPLGCLEYSELRQISVKTLCDLYLDSCKVIKHLREELDNYKRLIDITGSADPECVVQPK